MMAREVTDFPEPDSPTRPRTSPGWMEKDRLRTAARVRAGETFFSEPGSDGTFFRELALEEMFLVTSAFAGEGARVTLFPAKLFPATLGNSTVRFWTSSSGGTWLW
jgi:hypothetical protein